MKKYMIIFSFVLLLALSSVNALDFDNVKELNGQGRAERPNIDIINTFGYGDILWSGKLVSNTDVCAENCLAEKEIRLHTAGSLIDEIIFETILPDGTRIEQPIEEFRISTKRGSSAWQEYELGEELNPGMWNVRLEGKKEPLKTVDWIIKSQGVWIDEWAVWGGSAELANVTTYYKFNEGTGDAIDTNPSNPGKNNATNQGGVTFVTGKLNNASSFTDIANSYFSLATVPTELQFGTDNFTIAFWMKTSSAVSGNGAGIYVNRPTGAIDATTIQISLVSGKVKFLTGEFTKTAGNATNNDEWQRIVLSKYGTTLDIYINGSKDSFGIAPNNNYGFGSNSVEIGCVDSCVGERYVGLLDDMRFYKGFAWTQEEVTLDWNSGAGNQAGAGGVVLNSPDDNKATNVNTNIFNCSATRPSAQIVNISLFTNQSGTFQIENSTIGLSGNSNQTTFSHTIENDGEYIWTCEACDSDGDCGVALKNRTIIIDTTLPIIDITSPILVPIHKSGENLTLNWTIIEPNIDSCSFSLDDGITNVSVTCSDNSTSFSVETPGQTSLLFFINDSAGNLKTTLHSWSYILFVNSETFESEAFDTATESFEINISFDSTEFFSTIATLIYDGDRAIGIESGSGDNLIFSSEKSIPIVVASSNHTFYWEIILTNSSGQTLFNSTFNNQTINPSILIQCGAGSNAINYTTYDEENQSLLVTDFDATFSWTLTEGSDTKKNVSVSLSGENNYQFCINADRTFFTDVDINLDADGFTQRAFGFNQQEFSNDTTHQRLYLLNETLGTDFIIKLKDVGLFPLADYTIQIFRKLTSGGEILVENDITDHIGQIVARVIQNDAKYRILFFNENNVLVKTIPNAIFTCTLTICRQTFIVQDLTDEFDDFDDLEDHTSALSFDNNTNTFSFVWVDNRGEDQTHRLLVEKITFANGTEIVLNQTSTSDSGVLSYTADDSRASYRVSAFRLALGDERRLFVLNEGIGDQSATFSFEGLYWSFILFMLMLLVGRFHPPTGVILYLFSVFILGIFGIVFINPAIMIASLVVGVLFIWAWKG